MSYKHRIQRFWDKYASTYRPDDAGDLGAGLLDWLEKYSRPDDTVLEIGSGTGRIFRLVSDWRDVQYDMCDISPEMARRCTEVTGRPVTVYRGSLPYADNSMDWVLLFSVLLHVPPERIGYTLADVARVMRRYAFVSTFDNSGTYPLAEHCFRHDYPALFEAAGLAICESRHFEGEKQVQYLLRGSDDL